MFVPKSTEHEISIASKAKMRKNRRAMLSFSHIVYLLCSEMLNVNSILHCDIYQHDKFHEHKKL